MIIITIFYSMQIKYQQQATLSQACEIQYIQKLTCSLHHYPFQYCCNEPTCEELLCGKIQCIDRHFHNNSLYLSKINYPELVTKIQLLSRMNTIQSNLSFAMRFLKNQIDQMKKTNLNVFKNFKKVNEISTYLHKQLQSPLSEKYIHQVNELQRTQKQILNEMGELSLKINWSKIWITLEYEQQIILKLKNEFLQFEHLYFERGNIESIQQFKERSNYTDCSMIENEGFISILFTKQNFVVGEFIANNNVETAHLFLKSFTFTVDELGVLRKYDTTEDAFLVEPVMTGTQKFVLTFNKNVDIYDRIVFESGIPEVVSVVRLFGFLVTKS